MATRRGGRNASEVARVAGRVGHDGTEDQERVPRYEVETQRRGQRRSLGAVYRAADSRNHPGLAPEDGGEKTALDSLHAIFALTREIIKRNKRDCIEFTKAAVVVLKQVIRPFTARWHKRVLEDALKTPEGCRQFRAELKALQPMLRNYTRALADMAGVEDLTALEDRSGG